MTVTHDLWSILRGLAHWRRKRAPLPSAAWAAPGPSPGPMAPWSGLVADHTAWTVLVVGAGVVTLGYIGHCSWTVLQTDHSRTRVFRQSVLMFSILLIAAVVSGLFLCFLYTQYPSQFLLGCISISKTVVYVLAYAHAGSVLYWLVLHYFLYRETNSKDESVARQSLSESFLFGWLLFYIFLSMFRDISVQYLLSHSMAGHRQMGPLCLGLLFLLTELIPVSPTSLLVWRVNYAMSHLTFYSFTQRIAVPVARRMRRIIPYTTLIFVLELVCIALIYWDVHTFRAACPTVNTLGEEGPLLPFPTFAAVNPFVIHEGPLNWFTALSVLLFVYTPVWMMAFGFTARESALFMMSVGNHGYSATGETGDSTPHSEEASDHDGSSQYTGEEGGRASPVPASVPGEDNLSANGD